MAVIAWGFGNVALAKDHARDADTFAWLGDLARDVRRAARGLRKNPGFAATAIVSLALGIGANTALFTLANAIMLRPIGAHDPSRLIRISTAGPASRFGSVLPVAVDEIEQAHLFDGVCGFLTPADTVEINGRKFRLNYASSQAFGINDAGLIVGAFSPPQTKPLPQPASRVYKRAHSGRPK